jgi:hypothetical protein
LLGVEYQDQLSKKTFLLILLSKLWPKDLASVKVYIQQPCILGWIKVKEFSEICQPPDADAWLCSIEEMERCASHEKEFQ